MWSMAGFINCGYFEVLLYWDIFIFTVSPGSSHTLDVSRTRMVNVSSSLLHVYYIVEDEQKYKHYSNAILIHHRFTANRHYELID